MMMIRKNVLARGLLAAALALAAPPLAAQTVTPAPRPTVEDSVRQAYRVQIEQYRRAVAAAAAGFTDAARPEAQRLAAVREIATFDEPEHVDAGVRIAFDPAEPLAVRVRALELVGHQGGADPGLLLRLLAVAADSGTALPLRRAAMAQVEPRLFAFHPGHDGQGAATAALRRIARDPDLHLRRPALRGLGVTGDAEVLRSLESGLRSEGPPPLPAMEAVQVLGMAGPADHFPVLRQVLAESRDADARIAAIHLLGGDGESRGRLAAVLQDAGESLDARTAALGALLAGDPQGFPRHVLPVVGDESAPAELRVRAIKIMEMRRTTRDAAVLRRQADDFDRTVERVAGASRDADVQAAVRSYLTRTRAPH
jgi:hypothetical protein